MDLQAIQATKDGLKAQIAKVVVGQDAAVDLLLVALLSEGHILLEGVPGTAKTMLVQSFASAVSLEFGRIQFTPDLMPGDVIGTNLFNFQTNEFALTKGPIFTQLLLADEINRTPPKTQAALSRRRCRSTQVTDRRADPLSAPAAVLGPRDAEPDRDTRAPIRCRRRSSIASCSSMCWIIRPGTRNARSWRGTATGRRCPGWRNSGSRR